MRNSIDEQQFNVLQVLIMSVSLSLRTFCINAKAVLQHVHVYGLLNVLLDRCQL